MANVISLIGCYSVVWKLVLGSMCQHMAKAAISDNPKCTFPNSLVITIAIHMYYYGNPEQKIALSGRQIVASNISYIRFDFHERKLHLWITILLPQPDTYSIHALTYCTYYDSKGPWTPCLVMRKTWVNPKSLRGSRYMYQKQWTLILAKCLLLIVPRLFRNTKGL